MAFPRAFVAQVHLQRFPAPWDPLDGFNRYVRGPLREAVRAQIGNELEVRWHTCMTAILPMILYSSVNILGCDNESCEESARISGYSSVFLYMKVQVVAWALSLVTGYVVIFPVLLRMVKFVVSCGSGSSPLQCVRILLLLRQLALGLDPVSRPVPRVLLRGPTGVL